MAAVPVDTLPLGVFLHLSLLDIEEFYGEPWNLLVDCALAADMVRLPWLVVAILGGESSVPDRAAERQQRTGWRWRRGRAIHH